MTNTNNRLRVMRKKPTHPAEYARELLPNSLEGLRVTFINMPLRESAVPNSPPEGPAILAAILRREGCIPHILDLNGYRIKDSLAAQKSLSNGRHLSYKEAENLFLKHLNNHGDQDVVAFSGKITTLRWQEEMAKVVKKHQPDCFLVTGNGLATEIKEGLFRWIPELDAIARSEGDDVIKLIAHDARCIKTMGLENAALSGKLSPYYEGEVLGRPRFVYQGDRPADLDVLPYPAYDLLHADPFGHNVLEDYIRVPVWGTAANNSSAAPFKMERSLTTVSSRGCPYACAFCYRGSQGERNYGVRSANHIALQIKDYVEKYNLDFIGFPDDNFAVSKKRVAEFPAVFKEHGISHIRWGTHTRMDEAVDQRVFDMAAAGCVYIGFGAESASPHTLTQMKKGGFILRNGTLPAKVNGHTYEFPSTMVNAIKNCKTAGIHPNCTWIMAYPGEALEHLKTSVAFILWQQDFWASMISPGSIEHDIAKDSVNKKMFVATAYPGTEMWNVVKPQLSAHFGISYDAAGDPICDEHFHRYVLELDDATKVLQNAQGDPVNFGELPMDQFLRARDYVNNGEIEKILEL